MKEVILIEASNNDKNQKKYKCPYCDQRFIRSKLHIHIQDKHEDLIPEGYTALRIAFNTINHKDHGTCIICKEEAPWNEIKGRYERLCGKESCKEAYKKMVAERNKRIYGTDRLQSDPKYNAEVQKKALAGRKIAGKYKFDDGGEIAYVGSYERKLLEFLDKTMKCNSEDILSPGPEIPYIWNDQEHIYLPDFYYIPYNLIIEVKDGGDNKNNNPGVKEDNGSRLQAKEKAVKDLNKYSYIRLTNNNFGQLLSLMALLKYNLLENNTSPVYRINESSLLEQKINNPKLYFVSKVSMDDELLKPRIPDNYLTRNGYEDNKTSRVCFSETIEGCLSGLSQNIDGWELYVHVPDGEYEVIKPTIKQVPDANITKERWICSNVVIRCIGKIKVKDNEKPGIKYKYGNNEAELYTWDYEWIDKYDSINEGYIKSDKDIYYNKDKFDSGEINLCFITGLSGSGKSTMGNKMSNKNMEHYQLDHVISNKYQFTMSQMKEYGDLIYSFFNGPGKKYWYTKEDVKNGIVKPYNGNYDNDIINDFVKYSILYTKSHKNTKYVIEGIWLYIYISPDVLKDYAVYIKGTSVLISQIRAAKRDSKNEDNIKNKIKTFVYRITNKMNLIQEKDVQKYRNYFSKLMNKSVKESSEFKSDNKSNIVITDNLEIANVLNLRYPNAILITANDFEELWKYDLNWLSNNNKINTNKSFYDYIISNSELKQSFDNGIITKDLLIKYTPSYLNYLLYWCMKYKDNIFIIYSKYIQGMVDEYTLRNIKIYNESTSEAGMSGTIGAALPLTPSPTPYESDKDNYYIVNNLGNNAFAGDYSITKDPIEYNTYSFDVEDGYKVFKSKKIDKKSLVFKLKDKQSAKELYEEIENLYNNGLSITYPEYLYERYTGKLLLDPLQLLNEDSLELVYNSDIQDICESVMNYIYPKNIDILEEQVNDLIFRVNTSIHEYGIEDEYNVLPDDIATLDELEAWKDRYNFMTYDQKRHSNELSIQLYGQDNLTRYGIIRHRFLSEDPGNDDHMKNIGNSIGIDPIIDDIF